MFKSAPLSLLAATPAIVPRARRTEGIRAVCVFGGAKDGRDPRLVAAAAALGTALAEAGIHLVYDGGCGGRSLTDAAAGAAAAAGGKVIAIAPRSPACEPGATDDGRALRVVPDRNVRKQLVLDCADAFVALPGGIGTIEELAEILTDRNLGRHRKPVLLANFHGFWLPWLAMLDRLSVEGLLSGDPVLGHLVVEDPQAVIPALLRAGAGTRCAAPSGSLA